MTVDESLIRGAGEAGRITALIAGGPVCSACLARMSDAPLATVKALLDSIAGTLKIAIGPARCQACSERKTTFRLDAVPAAGEPPRPSPA